MTPPPQRRRVNALPEGDLDELEPHLGLWRFAWLWLTRGDRPIEEDDAPPEPPASEVAPSRKRRVSKRDASPPDRTAWRKRAWSWLARLAPTAQESKRRRIPIAVLRAYRKRAFTWLLRTREAPPEPEIIADVADAPAVEAPAAPAAPGKRKRGPKAPPPPPPPPPDPVTIFRRRAFAWFDEGGATTPLVGVQHPGGDVARAHLRGVLEALVFASEHPLPAKELARLARAELRLVKALLAELALEYRGRGFRLEEVAGGYIFRTSPAFAPFVREQVAKKPIRMSRAQVETLAIVAYRQPITRPEVDDVRGVDSGAVLKSLLERDFVRILGKKDEPGRPILYGTTGDFLEFFGLRTLSDLPTLREFTELNDESKRTYEREMGEEPPEEGPIEGGLMGGEGNIRKAPAEVTPPRPVSDYEDADGEGVESLPDEPESLPKELESLPGEEVVHEDDDDEEDEDEDEDDDEDDEDDEE